MLVAPRSATRRWPASPRNEIRRGGRPPVLGPISPSTTSPSSSSSPTRCATTPRVRPVRATSSDREREPVERISSRTVTSASSASSDGAAAGPGSASNLGLTRRSYGDTSTNAKLLHLTGQSTIGWCNSWATPLPSAVQAPGRGHAQRMRRPSDIGAAVIGSGFIGTVHIEALRRLGVQVHGLLGIDPRAWRRSAERIGVPKAYPSLADLLDDDRGRGRPRHLAEPSPPSAGRRDPGRGPPRGVREAAGDDLGRVARARRARRGAAAASTR